VHTLAMPVVNEVPELFRAVDGGATLALLAKLAVEKSLASKMEETRSAVQVLFPVPVDMLLFCCVFWSLRAPAELSPRLAEF
jgi:hypothetical protein